VIAVVVVVGTWYRHHVIAQWLRFQSLLHIFDFLSFPRNHHHVFPDLEPPPIGINCSNDSSDDDDGGGRSAMSKYKSCPYIGKYGANDLSIEE